MKIILIGCIVFLIVLYFIIINRKKLPPITTPSVTPFVTPPTTNPTDIPLIIQLYNQNPTSSPISGSFWSFGNTFTPGDINPFNGQYSYRIYRLWIKLNRNIQLNKFSFSIRSGTPRISRIVLFVDNIAILSELDVSNRDKRNQRIDVDTNYLVQSDKQLMLEVNIQNIYTGDGSIVDYSSFGIDIIGVNEYSIPIQTSSPGPISTPGFNLDMVSNLTANLDASNNTKISHSSSPYFISRWESSNSPSILATNTDTYKSPAYMYGNSGINNKNAVNFSSGFGRNSRSFLNTNFGVGYNRFTVFIVLRYSELPSAGSIVNLLTTSGRRDQNGYFSIDISNIDGQTTLGFSIRTNISTISLSEIIYPDTSMDYVYTFNIDINTSGKNIIRINNIQVASMINTDTSSQQVSNNFVIGGSEVVYTQKSNSFPGMIGQIVFYNKNLTLDEIKKVELFLASKWTVDLIKPIFPSIIPTRIPSKTTLPIDFTMTDIYDNNSPVNLPWILNEINYSGNNNRNPGVYELSIKFNSPTYINGIDFTIAVGSWYFLGSYRIYNKNISRDFADSFSNSLRDTESTISIRNIDMMLNELNLTIRSTFIPTQQDYLAIKNIVFYKGPVQTTLPVVTTAAVITTLPVITTQAFYDPLISANSNSSNDSYNGKYYVYSPGKRIDISVPDTYPNTQIDSFTVCVNMYLNSHIDRWLGIVRLNGSDGDSFQLVLVPDPNINNMFMLRYRDNNSLLSWKTNESGTIPTITPSVWTYLCVKFESSLADGSLKNYKLSYYYKKQNENTINTYSFTITGRSLGTILPYGKVLNIGYNTSLSQYNFPGYLTNIAFFDKAIGDAQINRLFSMYGSK